MLTFSIQNTNTFNKFKKSQNILSFKAGSQEFYYKVFDNLSKASKCGILNLNFKNPQDEKTFRTLLDSGYAVYQPWENLGFQHQMENFNKNKIQPGSPKNPQIICMLKKEPTVEDFPEMKGKTPEKYLDELSQKLEKTYNLLPITFIPFILKLIKKSE